MIIISSSIRTCPLPGYQRVREGRYSLGNAKEDCICTYNLALQQSMAVSAKHLSQHLLLRAFLLPLKNFREVAGFNKE